MNKKEFVKAVAAESGLTGVDAAKVVAAIQRVVAGRMRCGESIVIPGFGTFSVRDRKARVGRNPLTGEQLRIAARKVVKFSPGKNLDLRDDPTAKKSAGKETGKKTPHGTLF